MSKLEQLSELINICDNYRMRGITTILCHGCYDFLHLYHVQHLQEAKTKGDKLIVSITADKYVNKPNRPIFTATERAEMLSALEVIDHVFINDRPTSVNLLLKIKPNYYAKGSDYTNSLIHAENIAANSVSAQIYFTSTPKYSTTQLIERIKCL